MSAQRTGARPAVRPELGPPAPGRASLLSGRVLRTGPWSVRYDPVVVALGTALVVLIVVAGVVTMLQGTLHLSPREVVDALLGSGEERAIRTVRGRRLPRLLTAVLVGGCLGASGSVFQSMSRNVLGSPDIIGFTTGAATGAVIQIVVFDGGVVRTAIAAVVSGLLTALAVYLLARKDGVSGGYRLILVGIGMGATLGSVTSFLLVRASIQDASVVQQWSAGSLTGRGWPHVAYVACAAAVLLPALMATSRDLTYLEMGDDVAGSLGISVERVRFRVLVLGVGLAAVATAATGPISFVALAAPQIVARLTRRSGVRLVPSFLMGSALLVLADLLSQSVDVGLRTPVGLVTSLLGGLYLLWLLARKA